MKIDLHTHTLCSDGTLTPPELIARAQEAGVELFSITDHDSVSAYEGCPPGEYPNSKDGGHLTLISGCEFSTLWRGTSIHILGLDMDLDSPELQELIRDQDGARERRTETIAIALEKLGIQGALEGAKKLAGDGTIGRPHFARFLVAEGIVDSEKKAFKKYLGAGKPGDISSEWPSIERAATVIAAAGGVSVLAHPMKYKFTRTKLKSLMEEFANVGGMGVEVISGNQPSNETQQLVELCHSMGLMCSAGSDFHQPEQPWAAVGKIAALPKTATPVWTEFKSLKGTSPLQ